MQMSPNEALWQGFTSKPPSPGQSSGATAMSFVGWPVGAGDGFCVFFVGSGVGLCVFGGAGGGFHGFWPPHARQHASMPLMPFLEPPDPVSLHASAWGPGTPFSSKNGILEMSLQECWYWPPPTYDSQEESSTHSLALTFLYTEKAMPYAQQLSAGFFLLDGSTQLSSTLASLHLGRVILAGSGLSPPSIQLSPETGMRA
mmetsp:Transcript_12276/g.37838  ORF Transcript_12276/g.37838 Transcript_12276/m.37838 type:complete len:200 (-) Transcript_12276:352-951(-)